MRLYKIGFAFLLVFPLLSFAGTEPVSWEARVNSAGKNLYRVSVTGNITKDWYLYAKDDAATGLEAVKLVFDTEYITVKGPLVNHTPPVSINDQVFAATQLVYQEKISFEQTISFNGAIPSSLKFSIHSFAANQQDFLPLVQELDVPVQGQVAAAVPQTQLKLQSIDISKPAAFCGDASSGDKGLLTIFLLGFIGGLIALLTPCVFPMVPVTVSFFINRSVTRKKATYNGLMYGGFIALIYLAASIPFHLLANIDPEIFNAISTNAWVNVFFFAIFIFFALSFFGLFEIRLPGSLATRADAGSSIGNAGGIFFMALTLAIVSFSCTGPILGSLLVGSLSSTGGAWQLTAGMGGFGISLALPFALFAMFPNWLKAVPKSGGWLGVVKKVLAFLELALAFKFLSNADLVAHWGILKREVFIGIWLLITLSLSFYLLGIFERSQKPGMIRRLAGVAVLAFTFYLIPGLTNTRYANLKLLSGFPPPLNYSIYGHKNGQGKGLEPMVVNDYEKALALSREQNKPLLIDFTGWACVNCRKMEEHVWTIPSVSSLIKDNFILVSLYVDDRKKLPLQERFTHVNSKGMKKEIITVGDKWATLQSENFRQVTQPLYVVLSPDEKLLNLPVGYTPDKDKFSDWLQCGINAFRQKTISMNKKDGSR